MFIYNYVWIEIKWIFEKKRTEAVEGKEEKNE